MTARLLLVAPLLVLGLTGCGDDDKNSVGSDDDFCTVARELNDEGFDEFSNAETPEEVEAAITSVVDKLERAVKVAPEEIEAELGLLADVYSDIRDSLEESDWDLDAWFLTDDAVTIFAQFDEDAFADLELYLEDDCGIVTER